MDEIASDSLDSASSVDSIKTPFPLSHWREMKDENTGRLFFPFFN